LFDGQGTLDLVTHCQDDNDYDQCVLKEHLAYRLYNLVTPRSLRVRLAQATCVDSRTRRKVASRYAVFIATSCMMPPGILPLKEYTWPKRWTIC
jgi:hypothetical protein